MIPLDSSNATTTTTTRDRGDRYGPMEWAQKVEMGTRQKWTVFPIPAWCMTAESQP